MIKRINKIYLVLLLLITGTGAAGQTPYWGEDFMDPQEWTTEGNWQVLTGNMRFFWDPIALNYDMSATSPVITLEDRDYGLSIAQYLEPWMEMVTTEKAEISIISDGNEFVLWTYDLSNGPWGAVNGTEIDFDISAYAETDIQIRFRTFGPTTDAWFWWDVFSLSIITFLDNDMAVNDISGPLTLEMNETGTWTVEVKNLGLDYQKDFTVKLFDYRSGELIGSIAEEDSLGFGQMETYDFEWSCDSAYNTVLRAVIEHEGDEYVENNVSSGAFARVKPDREIKIAIWENDNAIPTIVDPEQGDVIRPPEGVKRTLAAAGFTYDSVYFLPDSLAGYDVILCIMGCYCLS
jgi:hypothetical protein